MNRPSHFVMSAGKPNTARVVLLSCSCAMLASFEGALQWWLGLAAAILMLKTIAAVRQRRTYLAWLAEWQAMGSFDERQPQKPLALPKDQSKRRHSLFFAATVSVFAIPLVMYAIHKPEPHPWLLLLWFVSFVYLAVAAIGRLLRKKVKVSSGENVVEWLLPLASDSPTRADAQRQLPGYTARLFLNS